MEPWGGGRASAWAQHPGLHWGQPTREGGLQSEWQMLFSYEPPRGLLRWLQGAFALLPSPPSHGQRPRPQAPTPSLPFGVWRPGRPRGWGAGHRTPFQGDGSPVRCDGLCREGGRVQGSEGCGGGGRGGPDTSRDAGPGSATQPPEGQALRTAHPGPPCRVAACSAPEILNWCPQGLSRRRCARPQAALRRQHCVPTPARSSGGA